MALNINVRVSKRTIVSQGQSIIPGGSKETCVPRCEGARAFRPNIQDNDAVRTWWPEEISPVKVKFNCHINFNYVSGSRFRNCNPNSGDWDGVPIVCVEDPIFNKQNILFMIVISVTTLCFLFLVIDFVLRRRRKGKLRLEKSRLSKMDQLRDLARDSSTRIRPFPSLSPGFVMANSQPGTADYDDDDDIRRHGSRTYRGDDLPGRRTPKTFFNILRPRIKM